MAYKLIDYERLKAFSEKLKTKYATKNDIPKKLSDLKEDTTHRLVTDTEKKNWSNKVSQSQITGDMNATGADKVWNVDFLQKQFGMTGAILDSKIDKFNVTDEFEGTHSNLVLSQKGANELYKTMSKVFSESANSINEQYFQKADKSDIPTKLSQLTNDKTFKTESEIQQMIEKASSLKKEVVTSLPTTGKDDVIYLVKDKKGKENNNYLEYLWLNGKYELIGSTQVDLSGYVTHTTFDLYQQESDRQATLIAEMQQITRHALTEQRISQAFPDTQPDKLATSGQLYALYQNMEAISGSIGQMGQGISEHFEQELQKALKKSDIQEFTQQELEEAFK